MKFDINKIEPELVIKKVLKVPIVKVNRAAFLRKELKKYFPEKTIDIAIKNNPAFAGVPRETVNTIAKQVINYETNKVATGSFIAGLPGGFAMLGAVPADVAQYFVYVLRVVQKLAYLYGFDDFKLNEDEIDDDTMNKILIFLGVMFGVQGANAGLKVISDAIARNIAKKLPQKALTKNLVYRIVKSIAQKLGIRMTKQIFADGIAKLIPIAGGFISGGISYATFKPNAKKLQRSLKTFNISDPEFYKNHQYDGDLNEEFIDVDFDDNVDDE